MTAAINFAAPSLLNNLDRRLIQSHDHSGDNDHHEDQGRHDLFHDLSPYLQFSRKTYLRDTGEARDKFGIGNLLLS